jgi:uncharacterized RDD family membrane protein YckC
VTDDVHRSRSPVDRLVGPLRDAILDSIDPNDIVTRIDVDAIVARIDVNELLDRVDPNRLLDRVEVNQLLDRVDPDRLLDRVDPDRLLDRVDPNRLLDRVDVDRLMARVDVDALVTRVDIDGIVASSTRGVLGSMIDLVRRQLVGLDTIAVRTAQRLRGVDMDRWPAGPPALVGGPDRGRYDVTGRYAGPLTRLVANAGDVAAVFGLFTLLSAGLSYLVTILFSVRFDPAEQSGPLWFLPLALVFLLYFWASVAIAGRTPGMAVLGIRVVDREGMPLSGARALVRTLVLPFSALFFGAGFLGLLFGRERRGLHDVAAGSTVVYDWGDRPASLPTPLGDWLARHEATPG